MNGVEWIVEAHGCDADSLRSLDLLRDLFDTVNSDSVPWPKPCGINSLEVAASRDCVFSQNLTWLVIPFLSSGPSA